MASDLLKLLPRSLHQDPVLVAIAEAGEIQLKQAYQEAEDIYNLYDIDKKPEQLLDLLAYEKHVDFYDNELSIDQKRELIKSSIGWHRKKGTRWAVEHVASMVFEDAVVNEWFEYKGKPYFFKIKININQPGSIQQLKNLINATKNKRSWLDNITLAITDRPSNEVEHDVLLKKRLFPETTWFGGRYNPDLGALIDGSWRINSNYSLNPSFDRAEDPINHVQVRETAKIENVFHEFEENLALVINGDWTLDSTHTLDNSSKLVKMRPIQHDVKILERKTYERRIDGTWYLDGSLTVGVQRMMNGSWLMDGEYFMDGNRMQTL
ncbi:phage tail protein I [Lysinibacillus sp. M3]|uniref:Phage tail protein I n=1 Tax=Lysinibacillus zambalensis TaxID=3160866 RepID=A0ABV1MTU2_9BACI